MRCCTTPGCGSYAINPGLNGRGKDDLHLCDVCYWKVRYTVSKDELAEAVRLLGEAIDSVEYEVQENAENWGSRLMHKQEPVIELLKNIEAFLSKHRSTT